ncbi:MAG: cytidylate kinase-like family protein, partial [Lachnospiraceae bacterium]|nr:cytidylate kinase-like family protein [Lachnospiraceae bacterium]
VGRCADYALAERKDTLNIFIFGNEDTKIKTIMNRFPELTEGKARDMMVKKDKQRQSYYNYYSSKKWGRADTYDLCINSSTLGVEGTVDLICQYVNDFENKKS